MIAILVILNPYVERCYKPMVLVIAYRLELLSWLDQLLIPLGLNLSSMAEGCWLAERSCITSCETMLWARAGGLDTRLPFRWQREEIGKIPVVAMSVISD